MTYGCPLCEYIDENRDTVFDHIFLEHGEETTKDARPIELGEYDDGEAGQCYEKTWKKEKIEKTELKITPTPKSSNFKKMQDTIKEMQMQITKLDKENKYAAIQIATTQQRVVTLESYLTTKSESSRRDFDLLAVDLKKEVLRRGKRGLNYNDIMLLFRFKSHQEAYRLMDIASKLFYNEIRIRKAKTKKQSNKLVPLNFPKN